jgi:hypothetical protein
MDTLQLLALNHSGAEYSPKSLPFLSVRQQLHPFGLAILRDETIRTVAYRALLSIQMRLKG